MNLSPRANRWPAISGTVVFHTDGERERRSIDGQELGPHEGAITRRGWVFGGVERPVTLTGMGLFWRSRGKESAAEETAAPSRAETVRPAAAPGRPEPRPKPKGAALSGDELRSELESLFQQRLPREVFGAQAVKLIAERTGMPYVALLHWEGREERFQLLGTVGLEDDAVQVLASGLLTWDIPRRAVQNKRINVIEAAHQNPFVPKPLVAISPRSLTIAVLPLYHADSPVGAAIFFSPVPQGFSDHLLRMLTQALRVCSAALGKLPEGAAPVKTPGRPLAQQPPALVRGLAAMKAEIMRLTDALEEAERQRATEAAERVTAQSFLQAQRTRAAELERELEALRAAATPGAARAKVDAAAAASLRGELDHERLRAAEAATAEMASLEAELERLRPLESEVSRLEHELEFSRAEAEAARERSGDLQGSVGEIEGLARELEVQVAELGQARDDLDRELAALRGRSQEQELRLQEVAAERDAAARQLDATRESARDHQRELSGARVGLERATALETEIQRLNRELAAVRTAEDAARARARELEAAAGEAHGRATDLEARAADQEARAAEQQMRVVEQEARARAAVAAHEALARELGETRATAEAQAAELTVVRAELGRVPELEAEVRRIDDELRRSRSAEEAARLRATELEEALRGSEAAARDLDARLSELHPEREGLSRELDEALRTTREQANELAGMRAELAAARSEAAAARTEIETAGTELARVPAIVEETRRLADGLAAAQARETAARDHAAGLEAALADAAVQTEASTAALAELRSIASGLQQELAAARRAAAERAEELAATRPTLERLPEVEDALERLRGELGRSQADAGAASARAEELQASITDLGQRLQEQEFRARDVEGARASLEQQLDEMRTTARERAETIAAIEARVRELTIGASKVAHLQEARNQAEQDRRDMERELERTNADRAVLRRDLEATRAALDATVARGREGGIVDWQKIEAEREQLAQEIAVVRDQARESITALETRLEAAEKERGALELQVAELIEALALNESAIEAAGDGAAPIVLEELAEDETTGAETEAAAEADSDGDLAIDRSDAEGPAAESAAVDQAPVAPPVPPQVAIVDPSDAIPLAAEYLEAFGYHVSALQTEADLALHVGANTLACAAVNLAEPKTWRGMTELRTGETKLDAPLLGYALPPNGRAGFWFGKIDFVVLPVDGSLLVKLLEIAPRSKRVLAMSSDTEVMWSVRTQMASADISTAIVFDARQAIELLPIVRPEAAILHMSPRSGDVFSAIAGIRNSEISRAIPMVFLMDEAPQSTEAPFITAGLRSLAVSGNLLPDKLANSLAQALLATRR
ncbi:MAG: hypothetical protein QOD06_1097 [Candidatus Binatota bacterium]|nr:hypothetical protein [Candidatus Binatota bacterium]